MAAKGLGSALPPRSGLLPPRRKSTHVGDESNARLIPVGNLGAEKASVEDARTGVTGPSLTSGGSAVSIEPGGPSTVSWVAGGAEGGGPDLPTGAGGQSTTSPGPGAPPAPSREGAPPTAPGGFPAGPAVPDRSKLLRIQEAVSQRLLARAARSGDAQQVAAAVAAVQAAMRDVFADPEAGGARPSTGLGASPAGPRDAGDGATASSAATAAGAGPAAAALLQAAVANALSVSQAEELEDDRERKEEEEEGGEESDADADGGGGGSGSWSELYRRAYGGCLDVATPPVAVLACAGITYAGVIPFWASLILFPLLFVFSVQLLVLRLGRFTTAQVPLSRLPASTIATLEVAFIVAFYLALFPAIPLSWVVSVTFIASSTSALVQHRRAATKNPGVVPTPWRPAEGVDEARARGRRAGGDEESGLLGDGGLAGSDRASPGSGSGSASGSGSGHGGGGDGGRSDGHATTAPGGRRPERRGPAGRGGPGPQRRSRWGPLVPRPQRPAPNPALVASNPAWCFTCDVYRPIRSKHCPVCDACVAEMDHHCPVVDNCIGEGNRVVFFSYLASMAVAEASWALALGAFFRRFCDLHGAPPGQTLLAVPPLSTWECTRLFVRLHAGLSFLAVLLVPIAIGTALLFIRMAWGASANLTVNEQINRHRYGYLHDPNSPGSYLNPFDRGVADNCGEFFFGRTSGEPTPYDRYAAFCENARRDPLAVSPALPTRLLRRWDASADGLHRSREADAAREAQQRKERDEAVLRECREAAGVAQPRP